MGDRPDTLQDIEVNYESDFIKGLAEIEDKDRKNLEKLMPEIDKGSSKVIDGLNSLLEKYPANPFIKLLLANTYSNSGDERKCHEIHEDIFYEHPDFINTRIYLATTALNNEDYEQVKKYLGEDASIASLIPGKRQYNLEEIIHFNVLAYYYLSAMGRYWEALDRFNEMAFLDPENEATKNVSHQIFLNAINFRNENDADFWDDDEEIEESPIETKGTYDRSVQTNVAPKLNHEFIETLYFRDYTISPDEIEKILSYPRETLVEDLNTLIRDGIQRYEFFTGHHTGNYQQPCFPVHAIYMLIELKATESLPVILDFFRQGEEFLNYWWDEAFTDEAWEIIYQLGYNQMDTLKEFMKEPGIYTYAHSAVSHGLMQYALFNPEKRDKVVSWMGEVLEYLLQNSDNRQVFDSTVLNLMVWDATDLAAKELLPVIEKIDEKGLLNEDIIGPTEEIREDIKGSLNYKAKYSIPGDIYERYNDFDDSYFDDFLNDIWSKETGEDFNPFTGIFSGDKEENSAHHSIWNSPEPYVNKNKVGRNDPCPCGSGKKYKKCCYE